MKISSDQIKTKAIAGKTKDGRPVVFIATKGGLNAFFVKGEDGTISSIGAAPHRAIARFLAGKKEDIDWNDDFAKSEDSLEKSEDVLFQKLRSAIFCPQVDHDEAAVKKSDVYMVYDITKCSIAVMSKAELEQEIKDHRADELSLIRDTSLSDRATLLKDSSIFKDVEKDIYGKR
jgi:hypothetical protein